jgi:hypothetical protein
LSSGLLITSPQVNAARSGDCRATVASAAYAQTEAAPTMRAFVEAYWAGIHRIAIGCLVIALLLFVGIHNPWDTVTYIAIDWPQAPDGG